MAIWINTLLFFYVSLFSYAFPYFHAYIKIFLLLPLLLFGCKYIKLFVHVIECHVFFSKQFILPLVIKKGHNGYIIQSVFPQPILCRQQLKKQIYVLQHRENCTFPRHIARYPYPLATTKVALFRNKPSQVIVMSHSILLQPIHLRFDGDQLRSLVFQEKHFPHSWS